MAKRTNKAGTSGRFGARYGVVIRNRVKTIEAEQKKSHECPVCHTPPSRGSAPASGHAGTAVPSSQQEHTLPRRRRQSRRYPRTETSQRGELIVQMLKMQ